MDNLQVHVLCHALVSVDNGREDMTFIHTIWSAITQFWLIALITSAIGASIAYIALEYMVSWWGEDYIDINHQRRNY